jgi:hypothetical protein
METRNEFLRSRPAQRTRNILFDLSNLISPVLIVVAGIIVFARTFAHLVGYNPAYTDSPVLVTKGEFLFLKPGYPFYNPFLIFLNIASKPFDKTINAVLFQSLFPLVVSAGLAVLVFFAVSAIRGYGINKGDNLYGSARWDRTGLKEIRPHPKDRDRACRIPEGAPGGKGESPERFRFPCP